MTKRGRWYRKLRRIEIAIWKHPLAKQLPDSQKTRRKLVRQINRWTNCWNGRVFKQRPETMSVEAINHRLFYGWTKRRNTPKRQRRFERWMQRKLSKNDSPSAYS